MTSAAHPIITSSEEPNWRTPDWLSSALRREFPLALDAAADSAASSVTKQWLGPNSPIGVEDALVFTSWEPLLAAGDAVFCNPPYCRGHTKKGIANQPIEPWIERLATTGQTRTAIGILPFAPQTRHWRRYVVGHEFRATEIRLFPFRVKFDPPPGYETKAQDGKTHGANVNTAVVIWKPTSEYPQALPWAPLQRYWVPREFGPAAARYHDVVEFDEEAPPL